MTIQTVQPFEELQRMCRAMNAPVFPRHKRFSRGICFVRKADASVEDVENFFTSYTNRERTVNET